MNDLRTAITDLLKSGNSSLIDLLIKSGDEDDIRIKKWFFAFPERKRGVVHGHAYGDQIIYNFATNKNEYYKYLENIIELNKLYQFRIICFGTTSEPIVFYKFNLSFDQCVAIEEIYNYQKIRNFFYERPVVFPILLKSLLLIPFNERQLYSDFMYGISQELGNPIPERFVIFLSKVLQDNGIYVYCCKKSGLLTEYIYYSDHKLSEKEEREQYVIMFDKAMVALPDLCIAIRRKKEELEKHFKSLYIQIVQGGDCSGNS